MITALLVPLNEEISCFVELNAIAIGGGGDYVINAYGGAGSGYIATEKIIFSSLEKEDRHMVSEQAEEVGESS